MIGPTAEPELCQARSETDLPCGRQATTSILGVRLCERCAREQEAYFAVGELTEVPRGTGTANARSTIVAVPSAGVTRAGLPAGLRRRLRTTVIRSLKVSFLVGISVSVLTLVACGETERTSWGSPGGPAAEREAGAQEDAGAAEATAGGDGNAAVAKAGDARARAGGEAVVRAGDARTRARDAVANREGKSEKEVDSNDRPRKVTLKVAGDPGTAFFGACSVGGHEDPIEGRVPERYAYDLDGSKLECEIRKEGAGALKVVAIGEGIHSVQRSDAHEGTIQLILSGVSASSTSAVIQNQTIQSSHQSTSDDGP